MGRKLYTTRSVAVLSTRIIMKIIFFQNRLKLREEQQALIDELRMRDAEDVHATKIKLETDVQVLEQQLESMRASYQLNQEKLVS